MYIVKQLSRSYCIHYNLNSILQFFSDLIISWLCSWPSLQYLSIRLHTTLPFQLLLYLQTVTHTHTHTHTHVIIIAGAA